MSNQIAVLALDGYQGGPRGPAVAIRPMADGPLEAAAFTRMLDGQEQSLAVGRELATADFAAIGTAGQLLEQSALRPGGGHHEAAIVRVALVVAVRDDPQAALRIDAEIIRALDVAEFLAIRVSGEVGVGAGQTTARFPGQLARIDDVTARGGVSCEQEHAPGELRGARVIAVLGELDDVAGAVLLAGVGRVGVAVG